MLNRFPSTGFNRINLDWIMRKLKKVENVTDNIGTAVEDAQQAAAEATTAAAGAVAAAGDATQAAQDAVEAIDTVTDQAAQAVQTANAAQSTATGASNTAATALSRANTAQSAAQQAQTTASGALAQADLAREETAALNDRFPVSIADGGTGATTAAAARANLDLEFDSGGSYCKMPDGTMLQWGRVGGLTFSNQTILEGTLTLPKAFIDTSFEVVCSPYATSVNQYLFRVGTIAQSTTSFSWTLGSGTSEAITIANRGFQWMAIGRWK